MLNTVSYLAYEELIKRGWFVSQFSELARDLEVLENYGHMEREQRRHLLQLAREVQSGQSDDERPASRPSPTQPIR